jgi:Raf kinase inhibitor-like YbhB/YbcL family protein
MFKKVVISVIAISLISGSALAGDFKVTSTDIQEGTQLSSTHVFNSFGCKGKNQSPQLSWSGAPEDTKSFVVTAYDPDAPTGSGWWHWVAFNIPSDVSSLPTNASTSDKMPKGAVQSKTDFGFEHFGGACPPAGEVHRYQFTVYALDVEKLDLDKSASPALVGFMTNSHSLDSAKLTAVYTR